MPDGDRVNVTLKMSGGGDVTLPKAVCDRHGWTAATVLEINDGPGGIMLQSQQARLFPPTRAEDVFGMLGKYYSGPPKTIEEMNAGIEAEVLARHARGRY